MEENKEEKKDVVIPVEILESLLVLAPKAGPHLAVIQEIREICEKQFPAKFPTPQVWRG